MPVPLEALRLSHPQGFSGLLAHANGPTGAGQGLSRQRGFFLAFCSARFLSPDWLLSMSTPSVTWGASGPMMASQS